MDTAPIIYFIETHPRYDPLMIEIFQNVASGKLTGVTSVISLTEVLIQPIRQDKIDLQKRYRDLCLHSANFETVPIDASIAERAADLRARYNLRTPDALQVAAALTRDCEAFLMNDTNVKRVTELRALVLDELEMST
jgi:predicted nucleic acid-binding protein